MSIRVVQVKEAEANNPVLSQVEGIRWSAKFTQFRTYDAGTRENFKRR